MDNSTNVEEKKEVRSRLGEICHNEGQKDHSTDKVRDPTEDTAELLAVAAVCMMTGHAKEYEEGLEKDIQQPEKVNENEKSKNEKETEK